jgi:hypothetical protein
MKSRLTETLKAGVIVGTLDILSALIYYYLKTGGGNPLTVLKYVASGFFGKSAFTAGNGMIWWGLLFHYFIAISFTFFFFLINGASHWFSRNKILTGVLYGIFTWLVMNLVVVPMSKIAVRPFDPVNTIINLVILIICIGIPLSYMASKTRKMRH